MDQLFNASHHLVSNQINTHLESSSSNNHAGSNRPYPSLFWREAADPCKHCDLPTAVLSTRAKDPQSRHRIPTHDSANVVNRKGLVTKAERRSLHKVSHKVRNPSTQPPGTFMNRNKKEQHVFSSGRGKGKQGMDGEWILRPSTFIT